MSRFPEPAGSRAVLLGAGRYPSGSGLHALPAVAANLADLAAALTDPRTGTLAPDHCTVVAEPLTPGGIGDAVARAAATATDLLLVYYSGHGLVDDRGRLHLALSTTDPDRLRWTAVPFDVLREEIADSAAAVRVLVLDCCFSGRAIHAMADHHGVITGQIDVAGTYTLTSSAANAPSHAPVGATHTSFTEALLTGLASPEPLTLDELFTHVYGHLAARGLPRPQRRAVNAAGALALSKGSLAGTAPPPAVSRGPRQADRAEPPATPGTGPGPAPSGLSRPDAASPSGPVRAGFVGSELPAPPAASAEAEAEAAPPTRPGRPDAGVGQRAAAGGRRPRPGGAARPASAAARLLGLAMTCLPAFLVVLDMPLGARLLLSLAEAQGIAFSTVHDLVYLYAAPFGAVMLLVALFGRAGWQRGAFGTGLAAFGVGSVMCAVASGPLLVETGRFLQGVGAALIMPFSLRLTTRSVPLGRERIAIGVWAAAVGLGFALNVAITETITDTLSWRWVFLLNAPVCGLSLMLLPALFTAHRVALRPLGREVVLLGAAGALVLVAGALVNTIGELPETVPYWAGSALLVAGTVLLATAVHRRSPTGHDHAVDAVPLAVHL